VRCKGVHIYTAHKLKRPIEVKRATIHEAKDGLEEPCKAAANRFILDEYPTMSDEDATGE
jgi:hypothetical protein